MKVTFLRSVSRKTTRKRLQDLLLCVHACRISKNILNIYLHWPYHLKQKKLSCITYIIDLSLESCVKDGNSS